MFFISETNLLFVHVVHSMHYTSSFVKSRLWKWNNYRVSQKKVCNRIFAAQGMEFLKKVYLHPSALEIALGQVTLPRNSIPCAENSILDFFLGHPVHHKVITITDRQLGAEIQ